jgi:protein-S-isoprenylcysteine O-methyltransferase Ste14
MGEFAGKGRKEKFRMYPLPFSGGHAYAFIFWATYALWLVLELIASRTKRSRDRSEVRDRGLLRLIFVAFWVALTLGFSVSFLLPKAAILWNRKLVFLMGIGLMLLGIAFRQYAMSVLGRFFTFDVAMHAGQTVVEAGPYRYIRHPSYTGALITQFGLGLALGTWAALFSLLFCVGIGYWYRMRIEEAALVTALGEPYRKYMQRTRRLVPFLF